MKKLFYFLTLTTSSLLFGQIELQKTISEEISTYSNNGETFYVTSGIVDKTVKIFDKNFNLYKEFNIDIPQESQAVIYINSEVPSAYILSKGIFDLDDKLDIVVFFGNTTDSGNYKYFIKIYNEDGEIIKNFNEYNYVDILSLNVFHDKSENINKLTINSRGDSNNETGPFTEVYTLPSNTLSVSDGNVVSSSLKVYPNPVSSVITIDNPNNGASEAKVFDMAGRLVKEIPFTNSNKSLTVNIAELAKGNYVIKIGNSVSKIIKN